MSVSLGAGDLSRGGAVMTTSAGDKVAVTSSISSVYVRKIVDGSPSIVDQELALDIFGGGAIGWVHAAIDGNDDIHVIVACDSEQTRDVAYAICDLTSGFGAWEEAADYTQQAPSNPGCSISLDGSDKPHILFVDAVKVGGSTQDNVYYTEKTGESWASPTQVGLRDVKTDAYNSPSITLYYTDSIIAFYYFSTAGDPAYRVYIGSWGSEITYTESSAAIGFGGVVAAGETIYRYFAGSPNSIEENNVDTGYDADLSYRSVSGSMYGTNRYVVYIDTNSDVHLISNDGGGWVDEGALQEGSYRYVIAEWSYYNENQVDEISYIFCDSTYVYYDSFSLVEPGGDSLAYLQPITRRNYQHLLAR